VSETNGLDGIVMYHCEGLKMQYLTTTEAYANCIYGSLVDKKDAIVMETLKDFGFDPDNIHAIDRTRLQIIHHQGFEDFCIDGRTVLRFHPMYISHGFQDITGNKQEFRQSWQKLYKLDGTVPFDGT